MCAAARAVDSLAHLLLESASRIARGLNAYNCRSCRPLYGRAHSTTCSLQRLCSRQRRRGGACTWIGYLSYANSHTCKARRPRRPPSRHGRRRAAAVDMRVRWAAPKSSRRRGSAGAARGKQRGERCLDVVQQAEEVELVGRHAEVVEHDRNVGVRVRLNQK
jgi:hypothetical protein